MNIASPTYHQTIAQFNGAVEFFLKTGFVMLEDPMLTGATWAERNMEYRRLAPPIPKVGMRKLLRKVAKELKRPVVVAERTYNYQQDRNGVITVKLRRLKRHAPLMSPFFLLDSYEGKSWEMDKLTPSHPQSFRWRAWPTMWQMCFIGLEGQEQFDEWMEFIQNSPECRKALRLPEANNVIPLAA